MHVVDMLVLGALLIGVVLGLLRGFLTQVTGVAGILGGLWLADRYHGALRTGVVDRFFQSTHNGVIAFLAILLGTVLLTALVGWALRKLVSNLELGTYDRLMGALFGSLKAALVCAGLLLAVATFAPADGGLMRAIGASRAGPLLWEGMDRAAEWLPGDYGDRASAYVERTRPAPPAPAEPPGPDTPGGGVDAAPLSVPERAR